MSRHSRHQQVGIDRLIRREWLERTVNYMLATSDPEAIQEQLEESLAPFFRNSSPEIRGSLSKTITILMKTWVRVPSELGTLRETGIEFFKTIPPFDRIPLHWGMIMAVYPFWGAVAGQVGRLLRLQGTATAPQVQRRLREEYGERETVSRRVRYALRSFIDWGVLQETGEKGVYGQGNQYAVEDPTLIAWMVEASLRARMNGSAATKDLLHSPSLFPFQLAHISAEHVASHSPRLNVLRHGLDDDLVMLDERGGVK